MRSDHLMLWMSSCKPITAVAVAQMWERVRLYLDDAVARHIPEFAANGKERVTVRHLLTHTAGFPNAIYQWSSDPWEKIIAQICAAALEAGWIPGQQAGYHVASAWYTLAEIIRRLDGRPYPQYVCEEIFEPLGMNDSWIGMPAERHHGYGDRIVPMHSGALVGIKPQPFGADFNRPFRFWSGSQEACGLCRPGGSAWGPIRELGIFYEVMLAGGKGILRPQTVEALTARHTVAMHDRTFGHPLDRGLGVVVDSKRHGAGAAWYGRRCSQRTFGHAGAWSSVGFADPEHRLAVALVFNGMTVTAPAKNDQRMIATLDALYNDLGLA
jgi:CubicO group peptidase (beta-lactamase class C family)